jgi:hypothetical protein
MTASLAAIPADPVIACDWVIRCVILKE